MSFQFYLPTSKCTSLTICFFSIEYNVLVCMYPNYHWKQYYNEAPKVPIFSTSIHNTFFIKEVKHANDTH